MDLKAPVFHLPVQRYLTCPRCGDGKPNRGSWEGIIYLYCRRCVGFGWKVAMNSNLGDVLKPNCWSGLKVYIVGGGQSAKKWDAKNANGNPTIACNGAWRLFRDWRITPTVSWSSDQLWLKKAKADPEYCDFVALRAAPDIGMKIPAGVLTTPVLEREDHWPRKLSDGIRAPLNNSGLSALSLADALGASEIHLIGFDVDGVGGDLSDQAQVHWQMMLAVVKIAPLVRARVVSKGPMGEAFK